MANLRRVFFIAACCLFLLAISGCGQEETITYEDGREYVGMVKDGKPHGQGKWTHPDGRKHVGEYKDGKFHGQGTATDIDGSIIYSGQWVNGAPAK